MECAERKSINDKLYKYDYLCNRDDNDFIEVTEWVNGEGYDISIGRKNDDKHYSLTHGELEAINYLIKVLEYGKD